MSEPKPVLWHIPVSHYNEKIRWALDFKGVEHDLRAPPPGAHMAAAMWLTRGAHKTFPVLRLDGRSIGDSTEIIAALEERYPDPPLYPSDPGDRARALELEDYFDEEVAPHTRLLAFHHAIRDRATLTSVASQYLPERARGLAPARAFMGGFASRFVRVRYGVADPEAASRAEQGIEAAFDRLEAELDGREYLVGSGFSVADLTAASLLYPMVQPPEGPSLPPPPASFDAVRARFRDRPGYRWVEQTFARHRRPASPP